VDGDPPAEQPSPSTNAAAEELLRLIHQALDKLDDATQKDIVRLQFFEGLSLRQIADRLGINREQVRQEFHAAMRQLEHDLRSLL
jgi:RNA polymerase sigma factor (sigma-70 family)